MRKSHWGGNLCPFSVEISSKHSVKIMSFTHSLRAGFRYSSLFHLRWKNFPWPIGYTDPPIKMTLCVCKPLLCSGSWGSYAPVSRGGLYHCYQTRVESDLCKNSNAMEIPLKDIAHIKRFTSSSSLCLHSQPYKRLKDLGVRRCCKALAETSEQLLFWNHLKEND